MVVLAQPIVAETRPLATVDVLADAVLVIADGARVLYGNSSARKLLRAEPTGRTLRFVAERLAPSATEDAILERLTQLCAAAQDAPRGASTRLYVNHRWLQLQAAALDASSVQLVLQDITDSMHGQAIIERMRQQFRSLIRRAEQAREDERKRIARDIHDDLGQATLALRIDVQLACAGTPEDSPERKRLEQIDQQIGELIRTMRSIINSLRPPVLDAGLVPALEWLTQQCARRSGMAVRFNCALDPGALLLDDERSASLFRMVQETLSNAQRHAQATEVVVSLAREPGRFVLGVHDNGRGLQPPPLPGTGGVGLVSLRERAEAFGGQVQIHSAETGTAVMITVPCCAVTSENA